MLVLTRQPGEWITLFVPGHSPIRIQLVDIKSARAAKIGIEAEIDVQIVRDELLPGPGDEHGPYGPGGPLSPDPGPNGSGPNGSGPVESTYPADPGKQVKPSTIKRCFRKRSCDR